MISKQIPLAICLTALARYFDGC